MVPSTPRSGRSLTGRANRVWFTLSLSLIVSLLAAMYLTIEPVQSERAITVKTDGARASFKFQDGKEMPLKYHGVERAAEALKRKEAAPRALATADLERNGVPDVVAGYAVGGMGIVTVQKGNPDAYAPTDDAVFTRIHKGYNPDPLLPSADVYEVPVPAEMLALGDFNGNGQVDVLVAARGSGLYLLPGEGGGKLGVAEQVGSASAVTALASGEFGMANGKPDIAVAVMGPEGPALELYQSAKGGLASAPLTYRLSGPASAIQFGFMDRDPFQDVAVAVGENIMVVHGWGREDFADPQTRVEWIPVGKEARSLVVGDFVWDREMRNELAVLAQDGTISILQRGKIDTRPYSEAEVAERVKLRGKVVKQTDEEIRSAPAWQQRKAERWTIAGEVSGGGEVRADVAPQGLLVKSNLSPRGVNELLVVDGGRNKLNVVQQSNVQQTQKGEAPLESESSAAEITSLSMDVATAPAAVVALPRKINGAGGVVVLREQQAGTTIIEQENHDSTIIVDTTADNAALTGCVDATPGDCSLRGAIIHANSAPGTTITVPAGTYQLTINGAAEVGFCQSPTTGDLDVAANNTTIVGAGAATTIIQQTQPNDRVLCVDQFLLGNFTFNMSGVTITGGRETFGVGGGGMVSGAAGNQTTVTSSTFSNNQLTGAGPGGGGINNLGGSLTVTNCTIGGSSAPGASQTDTNQANSAAVGGGGLSHSPGDPLGGGPVVGNLIVTGTTFQNNRSASAASGGGGADVFTHNLGTGTHSFATSAFTGNQTTHANGSGGALIIESLACTVATTSFTSNASLNRGGGIAVTGGSLHLDGTTASITFTSNTAPNGGSSIFANSPVTVSGTNVNIGGDVEVASNGTWTNNAGSTLSPTNFIVNGGAFTGNNSTMNVGGNLSIISGAVVGGTFNANTSTINIAGNFVYTTGPAVPTFNAGTGTFNFNGVAAQSISNNASITFNNLTNSNTTNPLTANGSFAVNGNLNVNGANAVFAPVAAAVISGTGTLTGTGTARVTRTGADSFLQQYTITNKTLTNLTVEYIGAAAQTVSATTYGGLKINNGSGATLGGNVIVNNLLSLTAGALNVATHTLTINDGTTVGTGSITSGATGTVIYNQGSIGQVVLAANYGNLTFSNFSKVLPNGTVGVASVFTPGSGGGHTITNNTFNFNGAGAQTVPAFAYNSLTISGARTTNNVTLGNASSIGVAGVFSPTATFTTGNYVVTNSTVDFNGTGAQSIPAFNFNNLTISGARTTNSVSLVNGGTIGIAGIFNPTATFTSGAFVVTGNTVVYNGTSAQSLPAAFTTYNNLTLNNVLGTSGFAGLTVQGLLRVQAGNFTSASNYHDVQIDSGANLVGTDATTINVSGNWTNNSSPGFVANNNTVNFNGSGAQTIGGSSALGFTIFHNLTIANAGTGVSLTQEQRVEGVLTLTNDLTTGANILIQPATGSSAGTGDVIGNVRRTGFVTGGAALSFGNPLNTIQINSGTAPTDILVNLVKAAPGTFPTAINRTYTITPNGGSPSATLRLRYLDSELNGNSEAHLDLWRFNGAVWIDEGQTARNAVENWVEKSGVTVFSPWTIAAHVNQPPSVTNASTFVNVQTTSGLVLDRQAVDVNEVTHFRITNITNGTLFKNDGTTQINNNDFITYAEGNAGLKFTPTLNSTATGSFDAQASSDAAGTGLSTATTATITVNPHADLEVSSKTDAPDPVNAGDNLTYTIEFQNNGPSPASTVTVTDTLPANTTFVSAQVTAGAGWNVTSPAVGGVGNVVFSKDPVPATETATFEIVVKVDAATSNGTVITNDAVAASATTDLTPGNNTGNATTTVVAEIVVNDAGDAADMNIGDGICDTDPAAGLQCTLRAAIQETNALGGDDLIGFDNALSGSTIVLGSALPAIGGNLVINGLGADLLTVQRDTAGGTPDFRIFHINTGRTVTISGLTLSNGSANAASPNDRGGAILNEGTLTINNSIITDNSGSFGGGIYNEGQGGASLTITNSTISNNSSSNIGGGLYNDGDSGSATMTIRSSTISGNSAEVGAGIYNAGNPANAELTVTNSTLSGNLSNVNGGGIFILDGTVTLTNVTVTNNRADNDSNASGNGGGLAAFAGTITLRNTLVGGNFGEGGPGTASDDILGALDTATSFNNLIGNGTGMTGVSNGVNGNLVGTDIVPIDPKLGVLADNGGPTLTHALLPGSPALDAGDNSFVVDPPFTGPTFFDQRGANFARIVDGPDADTTDTVDIGAFEAQVSVEDIGDRTINEDGSDSFTFNVDGAVNVTATSSNTALVPNNAANIDVTGAGATRTLTINPVANAFGATTITVTVADNGQNMVDTFVLTVNPVADTPSVTDANTDEDTQTTSGLVISRNAVDGAEVTHFKITGITNGALFQNDGVTPISNGDFITFAQGNAGLRFTPALDSTANGSFNVQGATGNLDAALGGGIVTATITVNAVNDAPVNSVPGPQTVIENGSLVFSPANSNSISISDDDAGTNPVQVQLTATNGTITVGSLLGLTFSVGNGSADDTMTFIGTIANINMALTNLQFVPTPGFDGAASLQIITNDQGHSGGPALSDTDTIAITVLDGGALQFSAATYSVAEDAGNAVITVTRSGGTAGEARINFATSNGTAVASQDYTAASGTLIFAEGVTTQTFNVPITDDGLAGPDKTINLTLSAPGGSGSLGTPATAVLTINDNEGVPSLSIDDVSVTEGDSGTTPLVFTVTLSVASSQTVTVNYATADGTAEAGSDYQAISSTLLSFAPGETSKTITVQVIGDLVGEPHETFFVNLSGATNAIISKNQGIGTIFDDDSPGGVIRFTSATFNTTESSGSVTINVERIGNTTQAVSADYATPDDSQSATPVSCATVNGIASSRCDFISALGTLEFAAGETSKSFTVLITQDSYVEGTETLTLTLSNPTGGAVLGAPFTAVLEIADDASEPSTNPSDDAAAFVRQHYHDFLNREPDGPGLAFWTNEITQCGADAACIEVKRINVSAAFFLSIEFQNTGFLAYLTHKAAFGNLSGAPVPVKFVDFLADVQKVSQGVQVGVGSWETILEQNKEDFILAFVERPDFLTQYPNTLTAEEFVDQLDSNAGGVLSNQEKADLVAILGGTPSDLAKRAEVLRKVAEDDDFEQLEFNRAFVMMQYFGYLRRDPDAAPDSDFAGYNFWLGKLNDFNGNFVAAEMVKAFITSGEYRQRFGP